jgi:PhnB protein
MATINPYLSFNGNCEGAFKFYKSIFGGEFEYIGRYKDMPGEQSVPDTEKEKIMHVSLPIGGNTVLMGADSSEYFGVVTKFGDNISLSINTEKEEDAKRIFKALSEGGKILMPLEKTFWSTLFGHVVDKFGIYWMVNYN